MHDQPAIWLKVEAIHKFKIIASSALAAAALCSAGTANAQASATAPSASDLRPNANINREINTRTMMEEKENVQQTYNSAMTVARCVNKIAGDKSSKLMGGPMTDDADYSNLGRAMRGKYRGCAKEGGEAPGLMITGSLTELSLLGSDLTLEDRAMSLNMDEVTEFHQHGKDGKVTLDTIGRCVSAYSPGLVYKVLQAGSGTADELAAMDAAYSQTPECGVSARPAKIAAPLQRAAMANALYHWVNRG